jgi:hypothetical protein
VILQAFDLHSFPLLDRYAGDARYARCIGLSIASLVKLERAILLDLKAP